MHQIQTTIETIRAALKDAADLNPVFLATPDKGETLLALGQLEAQLAELRLRVIAAAHDLADQSGARDVGTWLVAQGVTDPQTARADLILATALEHHPTLRTALAHGTLGIEHARIITHALDNLPTDLPAGVPPDLIKRAETHLCDLAKEHRPSDLRRLGAHLLEVVAPELAEETDARAIARLEAETERTTTLSITPLGTGLTRIHALVPDPVGQRLRTLLESFAQPRIAALDADGKIKPRNRIMAHAFAQLLECLDPRRLPLHGGDATTIVITLPLDQLRRELGIAQTDAESGQAPISAAQARRLACTATIIPAVLDGRSEPLDLGRARRLFTPTQRKALRLRDHGCRAEGCTVPATWCDAHHLTAWSRGGPTTIDNGLLLCNHHHHRAHDPGYHTTHLPNGTLKFHRRT